MLTDELVKRHIGVEGTDQVIPIFMCITKWIIKFMPIGLGISNQIHPVPRPFLSEMRRLQQFIYHFFISLLAGIAKESRKLVSRGWQTDQIKIHTSQPGPTVCFRRGLETRRFNFVQDESIQIRTRPLAITDPGQFRFLNRTPTPMFVESFLKVDFLCCGRRSGF